MRIDFVITTCGKTKAPHAAPAAEFYRGTTVRTQARVCAALKPRKGRIILSNKYGFMRPDTIIPGPYDSHWGYPDTMPDDQLRAQLKSIGVVAGSVVVCLGAREYAMQTARLVPDGVRVFWPAKHYKNTGITYQRQLHSIIERLGRVPSQCFRDCEVTREA